MMTLSQKKQVPNIYFIVLSCFQIVCSVRVSQNLLCLLGQIDSETTGENVIAFLVKIYLKSIKFF